MSIEIPTTIQTNRLILRKPESSDAAQVFENYASDLDAVLYMSWHRHLKLAHSEQFVEFCLSEWEKGRGGAYIIVDPDSGRVIGSTGMHLETQFRATTGYILCKDRWGQGLATEALQAMVDLALSLSIDRLYAYCHHEHRGSARVMEKCGFEFEGVMRRHTEFPNHSPGMASDVLLYAWVRDAAA